MLLERLDATRPLSAVADTRALQILAELLARLVVVPAPHGLRHLAGIAAAMLGGGASRGLDPARPGRPTAGADAGLPSRS